MKHRPVELSILPLTQESPDPQHMQVTMQTHLQCRCTSPRKKTWALRIRRIPQHASKTKVEERSAEATARLRPCSRKNTSATIDIKSASSVTHSDKAGPYVMIQLPTGYRPRPAAAKRTPRAFLLIPLSFVCNNLYRNMGN